MLLFKKNDRFSNKRSLRGKPGEEGKRTVCGSMGKLMPGQWITVYDTAFKIGPEPKTILPGRRSRPYSTHMENREKGDEEKKCRGVFPVEYGW